MRRVHIVGAGLAGLSAAVALTQEGQQVTLYEAGPAAGGRCRSYFDRELGCRIDNGNHLLLSGNSAAMIYLETIGARRSRLESRLRRKRVYAEQTGNIVGFCCALLPYATSGKVSSSGT